MAGPYDDRVQEEGTVDNGTVRDCTAWTEEEDREALFAPVSGTEHGPEREVDVQSIIRQLSAGQPDTPEASPSPPPSPSVVTPPDTLQCQQLGELTARQQDELNTIVSQIDSLRQIDEELDWSSSETPSMPPSPPSISPPPERDSHPNRRKRWSRWRRPYVPCGEMVLRYTVSGRQRPSVHWPADVRITQIWVAGD